jgi:AcrR family transcriptional regulator
LHFDMKTVATTARSSASYAFVSRPSPIVPAVQPDEPAVPPAEPTRLRERFRKQITAAIAAAAEEVFAEEGLRDAHVGHIASRAGVAVGTLYNHYEDRDALLAALLSDRCDGLTQALDVALAEVEGAPFRAELLAFVTAYFAFVSSHRPFFKILLEGELSHLQSTYPRAAALPSDCYRAIFERIEGIVSRGVGSGALRAERTGLFPWLVGGMMRSLAVRDVLKFQPLDRGDAEALVHVFLHGAQAA